MTMANTSANLGPSLAIATAPGNAPNDNISTGKVVSAPKSVWLSNNSVSINDGSTPKEASSSPSTPAGSGTVIEAPLGGNIFRLIASEGESVAMDSTVLILEAMKMETEIKAPTAGVIGKIFVKPGDTVKPGTPLFEVIN